MFIDFLSFLSLALPSSKKAFNTSVSLDPINAEIIAGGASLAPSL
jgi:hypothetical protein